MTNSTLMRYLIGKTYEELRQVDGPFGNAHKLNEIPNNLVINILGYC